MRKTAAIPIPALAPPDIALDLLLGYRDELELVGNKEVEEELVAVEVEEEEEEEEAAGSDTASPCRSWITNGSVCTSVPKFVRLLTAPMK